MEQNLSQYQGKPDVVDLDFVIYFMPVKKKITRIQ